MKQERLLIALFCVIAGARVAFFASAFPFFNNVDEGAHVDLVFKYSRGYLPQQLDHYSADAARFLTIYATQEYLKKPAKYGEAYRPPPWTLEGHLFDSELADSINWWQSQRNHESGEPPLYYALAGLWLNLGRGLHLKEGSLLYWIRSLNIFVAIGIVCVGFKAGQVAFGNRKLFRLSVPLLLAVWPQSAIYSVQPDALCPLVFGLAFVGIIKLLRTDAPNVCFGALVGLALSATVLTKPTGLPLLSVVGLGLLYDGYRRMRHGQLRKCLPALGALLFFLAVPISLWFSWNWHFFGDLTATSSKIQVLGWTPKPFSRWWPHPIFALTGAKEFWSETLASFWRGEFVWHGERLAAPWADHFYSVSSATAILVALIGTILPFTSRAERQLLWIAIGTFSVLLVFLALISVSYDFDDCFYPSRADPFLTSGRLLASAAIPFFIVYVFALDLATRPVNRTWLPAGVVLAIALMTLFIQTRVNLPPFSSTYNFFHM